MKVTITQEDGSTQEFFPQSYTDTAVAAALANVSPAPTEVVHIQEGEVVEVVADPAV